MTLAWSRHQYAEVVKNQTIETWLACHRHAFEWLYWLKWTRELEGQVTQRICVATVDLRDLNSVAKQLEKIFPAAGHTLADSLGPMRIALR